MSTFLYFLAIQKQAVFLVYFLSLSLFPLSCQHRHHHHDLHDQDHHPHDDQVGGQAAKAQVVPIIIFGKHHHDGHDYDDHDYDHHPHDPHDDQIDDQAAQARLSPPDPDIQLADLNPPHFRTRFLK